MSKVGKFLIARPEVQLGEFGYTVIFIYEDSDDGVTGLAVTTASPLTLRDLIKIKEVDSLTDHHVLYKGGPVAPNSILMLHTEDFSSTNTLHTGVGLDVSSDTLMTDKLLMGNEPKHFKLITGCSAWAPGQLDSEISQGYWLLSELDHKIIFELDGDPQWNAAVAYAGRRIIDQYF
jgi:putative transcriptional regulator